MLVLYNNHLTVVEYRTSMATPYTKQLDEIECPECGTPAVRKTEWSGRRIRHGNIFQREMNRNPWAQPHRKSKRIVTKNRPFEGRFFVFTKQQDRLPAPSGALPSPFRNPFILARLGQLRPPPLPPPTAWLLLPHPFVRQELHGAGLFFDESQESIALMAQIIDHPRMFGHSFTQ